MRSPPLVLAVAMALALCAPAMAQGPAQDGYTAAGPQVIEQTAEPGDSGGASGLPFTGMDLLFAGGLGAGLMAAGAGMRRLTRPPA